MTRKSISRSTQPTADHQPSLFRKTSPQPASTSATTTPIVTSSGLQADFSRVPATTAMAQGTIARAPKGAGSSTLQSANMEGKLIQLLNQKRAEAGLPPLQPSDALAEAARRQSKRMVEHGAIHHAHLEPGMVGQVIGQQPTVESLVEAWMGSAGHRQAITNPKATTVGVAGAYADDEAHTYWIANFGQESIAHTPKEAGSTLQSASIEGTLIQLLNQKRAEAGLPPLQPSDALTEAARRHSRRMAEQGAISHAHLGGGVIGQVIGQQPTVESLIEAWMGSAGHRQAITNPKITSVGVAGAYADDEARTYWTANFGH